MKMIKSIAATNFKGRSFKNKLSPVTVFIGDNFTGKSSRKEALNLALAGFLPDIEKKAGSIHSRLASGQTMSVVAEFDDGKMVGREYTRNEDGEVKGKTVLRGLPKGFALEPELIDPTEFLTLSANGRVKYLAQKLPPQGEIPTPEVIFAKLATTGVDNTDDGPGIVADLQTEMQTDYDSAVVESKLPPQVWLDATVQKLDKLRLAAITMHTTLLDEHAALNRTAAEIVIMDPAKVAKRLETARSGLASASEVLNRANTAAKSATVNLNDKVEQQALATANAKLEQARAAVKEADANLKRVSEMTGCPTCGAKKKGWREIIDKMARENLDVKSHLLDAAFKAAADAKTALEAKQAAIKSATEAKDRTLDEAVSQAELAVEKANGELALAKEEEAKLNQQNQEINRREQQKRSIAKLSVKVEILKALCKIAQEFLDVLVADSIQPLLDRVNTLCEGILPAPVSYLNRELGMIRGDSFATWRSFSGCERTLFYCGVQMALAAQSELKLLVLDELGNLTDSRKALVLERIGTLIDKGVIHQAILIEARELGDEKPAQWWRDHCPKNVILQVVEVK